MKEINVISIIWIRAKDKLDDIAFIAIVGTIIAGLISIFGMIITLLFLSVKYMWAIT